MLKQTEQCFNSNTVLTLLACKCNMKVMLFGAQYKYVTPTLKISHYLSLRELTAFICSQSPNSYFTSHSFLTGTLIRSPAWFPVRETGESC